MNTAQQELENTLDGLRDFQRATVDRLMILFNDPDHGQRILVADEVGLGKTIIAKGIIARLLQQWREPRPLRIAYICSNQALAEENRKKLAVFTGDSRKIHVKEPSFRRLAELAMVEISPGNEGKLLEICTLTPATSFSVTHGFGNMRERCIIYSALTGMPELGDSLTGLERLFQYGVMESSWAGEKNWVAGRLWNGQVIRDFHEALDQPREIPGRQEPVTWLEELRVAGLALDSCPHDMQSLLLRTTRVMLVKACAANLAADLFILDEFQRFDSLINTREESEQALIARQVFSKERQDKVLLLSATPFKAMSTLDEDEMADGHLHGLRKVLGFLNRNAPLTRYEQARQALQTELLRVRQENVSVADLSGLPRRQVEEELRPLISRTERAQIAVDVDDVLETKVENCLDDFGDRDIDAFLALDEVARQLGHDAQLDVQLMEFFKSAAWPLSFSQGYKLRQLLQKNAPPGSRLQKYLDKQGDRLWLPCTKINEYTLKVAEHAPNAKVRLLTRHLFGGDHPLAPEMMLWISPSLPHYPLSGPFAGMGAFSKSLVFSAWAMVPRMLSGLLSYEAERRVKGRSKAGGNYFKPAHNPVLHFDGKSTLAGWAVVYPAKLLIAMGLERRGRRLEELLQERETLFLKLLKPLRIHETGTRTRAENWYAMAPILLDKLHHADWLYGWLEEQEAVRHPEGRGDKGRLEKLGIIRQHLQSADLALGPMPKDLAQVLALLSVGSPAVCSSRALAHYHPRAGSPEGDSWLRKNATRVAFAFSQLFNSAEGVRVINRFSTQQGVKPLQGILRYCAFGGMQAMLDEYHYMLMQSAGDLEGAVKSLCNSATVTHSRVEAIAGIHKKKEDSLRCHYAVALGTQRMEDAQGLQRVINIREAFNSPFRPFVLTSTSIGQEGLDFHWYCSEVIHWNLPHNPIDMEQREGRVNRYKSLVVRRRVAEHFAASLSATGGWDDLFDLAVKDLSGQPGHTDLVPFWHIPTGRAKIHRIVPMLPLSRETQRYRQVLKILALYRLAFGQPRQQELLGHLLELDLSAEEEAALKHKMIINLAPICFQGDNNPVARKG